MPLKVNAMKHRMLGDGLEVSALGLGCMPMVGTGSVHYGAADAGEAMATLARAIDLGVTFFDTAEVYAAIRERGDAGREIKERRDGLVIATKFAFRFEANGMAVLDSSPRTIKRAL